MSWHHFGDYRPVARKTHRCFLCAESIPPGTQHLRRDGVSYRQMMSFRMHLECDRETWEWDADDWETFTEGSMPQPNKQ